MARDVDRVRAAQDGGVERHEVAEQDERDEPLDAGLAARGDAQTGDAPAPAMLRGQLGPQRVARVRGGVLERDVGELAQRPRRVPADDLVVAGLGQHATRTRAARRSR